MINSFKDLIVWQKSIQLAKEVYKITESFQKSELFGMTSQMRRASVAIPSNIAEGFSRKHRKEYRQFLLIAFSSAAEVETYFILSKELGLVKENYLLKSAGTLEEIQKMLNKIIRTLSSYE